MGKRGYNLQFQLSLLILCVSIITYQLQALTICLKGLETGGRGISNLKTFNKVTQPCRDLTIHVFGLHVESTHGGGHELVVAAALRGHIAVLTVRQRALRRQIAGNVGRKVRLVYGEKMGKIGIEQRVNNE